jgi:hypothetical protein
MVALRSPHADRDWEPSLSRAPVFESLGGDSWRIRNFRAFVFGAYGPSQSDWRDETVNAGDLQEIWFFVEPFEYWDGAAHNFMSFVFDGETGKALSVSVEARKEKDETYSPLRGALNAYELLYLWSTEKDVMTRIAVSLDHDLYAYRLNLTREQAREVFLHFVERTNALTERPRFYNTLTSNCTNELAKAVNDAFPGALPWHYSNIFTGFSAERLYGLGFLAGDDEGFDALTAQAEVGAATRALAEAPEGLFSPAWRARLADRQEQPPAD